MIAIATLAFLLIVVIWLVAPNGATTIRQPQTRTDIAQADATA